jgi:hypothetical protein
MNETIALHENKISHLKIRSVENGPVLARFDVDHDGGRSIVDGSFMFETSDDPEIHHHHWHQIFGEIVSSH